LRWQTTTGLTGEQLDELVDRVDGLLGGWDHPRGRPRALDLYTAVVVTLALLRHNLAQALAAELWQVSQPTISRVFAALRVVVGQAAELTGFGLADVPVTERVLVDGTLLPTGDRAGQEGLYSGKRHRSGLSVHVVGDLSGRLLGVSDPMPGAMHDAKSFVAAGVDRLLAGRDPLADLGYLGCGVSVPFRKPPGGELDAFEKAFNRAHAARRAAVERTIAHFKDWQVVSTGYRGPLAVFPSVIRTVDALQRFKTYSLIPIRAGTPF
jgi:DDE superfamily endonuclease